MKKIGGILVLMASFTYFGCNQKNEIIPISSANSSETGLPVNTEDSFIDPGNFFTPDYTPYTPEKASVPGKISTKTAAFSGKVKNVDIPNRKLSDYSTSYITSREEAEKFRLPSITTEEKPVSTGDLTVSDWGPKGVIPAEVRRPSFYVLFSQPMIALSALENQPSYDTESGQIPPFTIEPPLAGKYVWKGSRLLCFDCSENADPLTSYSIRLNPAITSLTGSSLTGPTSYTTTAAPLKILWYAAGYSQGRCDLDDVTPEFSKDLRVQFNYPVEAEKIAGLSSLTVGGKTIDFTVSQDSFDTVTYTFKSSLPPDSDGVLSVGSGGDSKKAAKAFFHTLKPLTVTEEARNGWTHGKYTNPISITFNHSIDEKSLLKALSTQPQMEIGKENVELEGSTLTIYALPVTFNSKYTLTISSSLKDIYGQKLEKDFSFEITVPNAESQARFTDSGVKILESVFPHRMVFEYQNILSGKYALRSTSNPLEVMNWNEKIDLDSYPETKDVPLGEKNKRNLFPVDLDPLLKNGKGWVRFDAAMEIPKKPTKWDPSTSYSQTNKTSIQVTDLAATVRYGVNRVDVLVSQISSGKPLEGAEVYVYSDENLSLDEVLSRSASGDPSVLTGKSGKNGLASLEISGKTAKIFYKEYWAEVFVLVKKDDDMMVFQADSHYAWKEGVVNGSASEGLRTIPRIFMFSDRGLYKPGETLSFRGIDRTQSLGSFIPYTGNYVITLKEDAWRDAAVLGQIEGETSESGGFYGSFTLGEDVKPGIYLLEYQRKDEKKNQGRHSIPINIAFFERLKFQADLEMPKTPILSGEKIQSQLSASYLAGGSLAQARYESSWFCQSWYFTSDLPQFKDYKFGPINTGENRKTIKEGKGKLDGKGQATLSCATSSGDIKGAPYRYRLSARVTDSSNQLIQSAGAVVVHPASFYLGLSKPKGVTSFAKKGEKLEFSYAALLASGEPVTNQKTMEALAEKQMKVSLTRTEWNLVQQQGISSNVYSRYEESEVEESSESIKLEASGTLSVTPVECGYHTIHLTTKDKKGRDVVTEYSFYVTGSGRVSSYQEDASSVNLTPDQSQYNPGETAHILLESALEEGYYLITVEREGIFTEEVRYLEGNVHVLDIPVARNYVPVFYVSVSSYSVRKGEPKNEYGQEDLDKPKGYFGTTAVFVNPLVKSFSLAIESEKSAYRSGEEASVLLTATKGGKPLANAELTLMAVDRGVLDLINYHVPNPIEFYYDRDKFPLRVHGGDSREYLMDPVTYETRTLAGGDFEGDEKMEQRKDFNPTAVFLPVLKTDEKGQVRATFKLPDTLTTYRLTAFGVKGELLALQEDEIVVQNPINAQQILPRRLRERDTAEVGVLLTNLDSQKHEVQVDFALRSREDFESQKGITSFPGRAIVEGQSTHRVTVPSGASLSVYFEAAAQKAGQVEAVFTVKSDIINEEIIAPLIIEKPVVYESFTTTGMIEEGREEFTESLVIPSWAADGKGELAVTIDATRLGSLDQAVHYLFDYPYGCLEQQIGKILPLLIFEKYIDVFNLDSKVSSPRQVVSASLKEWAGLQHKDGGFGYWPSSSVSSWYVSARIAQIIALAKKAGYSGSELFVKIKALLDYLENERDKNFGKKGSRYQEAYITWVLALNGRLPSEQNLSEMMDACSGQDCAELAMTGLSALEGDFTDIANRCGDKIRTYLRPTTRGVDLSEGNKDCFFESQTEELALMTQLFIRLDKNDEWVSRLLYSLMEKQKKGYWQNTAATASALQAFATVISAYNLEELNQRSTLTLADRILCEGAFEGAAAKPLSLKAAFDSEILKDVEKDKALPLKISRQGSGNLYYTATMKYALPQELQKPVQQGIDLIWELFDSTTDEKINTEGSQINLERGKIYKAVVTLSSSYDLDYLALRAPVPSGGEILDATFATSPDESSTASGLSSLSRDQSVWGTAWHYMSNQQIFDNEIQFFWDSFEKGMTTVEFKFRAVRKGVYPTPPGCAECMYQPEIFGRSGGSLFVIK